MRRGPSSPWLPFPFSPHLIPDGRISRVRLAATASFTGRLPHGPNGSRARSHTPSDQRVIHPASLLVGLAPHGFGSVPECGGRLTATAHREPLCASNGIAVRALRSWHRSASVTPPSSLLRAHAPDRTAPVGFGLPYSFGSLQVASSPCCRATLPDVISAIPVPAPGSVPRHAQAVPLSVSSRLASALPKGQRARLVEHSRNAVSRGGAISGLQPFALVQAPLLAWPTDCSDVQGTCPCRRWAVYAALNLGRYRSQAAVSLRVRIGQLTR